MSLAAPPLVRRRPWAMVERALKAVGVSGRMLVIAAPAAWLTIFFLIPIAVVAQIAFSERARAIPPYLPLLPVDETGTVKLTLHLSNFISIIQNNLYVTTYFNSIKVAAIATL